jgi:hypothetical protein
MLSAPDFSAVLNNGMNNYRLTTADRLTHAKIVGVSLVASLVVVCIGKSARSDLSEINTRTADRSQVLMADKPSLWTRVDIAVARRFGASSQGQFCSKFLVCLTRGLMVHKVVKTFLLI